MGKLEVEVKLRVPCEELEALARRLGEAGSQPVESREEDVYYSHPCRSFLATDEALRVRLSRGRVRVTYKGPRLPGRFKARVEIEAVAEGDVGALLEALGFHPAVRVVKHRRYYSLDGATVALDRVEGLGCFVEVEAPTEEELARALEALGVEGEPVQETYAELVARRGGPGAGPGAARPSS